MKAPEKLYLRKRNKIPLEVVRGGEWCETEPKCMYGTVEYTRTDAFIEKAVKYIANHFLAPGMDNEIEDFRNYMKGE